MTTMKTFFFGFPPKPPTYPGCITVDNAFVTVAPDGTAGVLLDREYLTYVDRVEAHCFDQDSLLGRLELTVDGIHFNVLVRGLLDVTYRPH